MYVSLGLNELNNADHFAIALKIWLNIQNALDNLVSKITAILSRLKRVKSRYPRDFLTSEAISSRSQS